jgi:hypothetical protein
MIQNKSAYVLKSAKKRQKKAKIRKYRMTVFITAAAAIVLGIEREGDGLELLLLLMPLL